MCRDLCGWHISFCINYARQPPSQSQATDFVRLGDERMPGPVTYSGHQPNMSQARYMQSFYQASLLQGLNQTRPSCMVNYTQSQNSKISLPVIDAGTLAVSSAVVEAVLLQKCKEHVILSRSISHGALLEYIVLFRFAISGKLLPAYYSPEYVRHLYRWAHRLWPFFSGFRRIIQSTFSIPNYSLS